jgi:Raf kinase inhibitor-like YbhB/YbcL family protein
MVTAVLHAVAALMLSSPAFHAGATIPARYTCDGQDLSPPLRWSRVPRGTRTFALRIDDPDAPGGTFIHWTAWNFVRGALALRAGAAGHWPLSGTNSFGRIGYGGPCPPSGPAHHYVFRLFAVDTRLALRRGASVAQFAAALRGHVLATARLVGLYRR